MSEQGPPGAPLGPHVIWSMDRTGLCTLSTGPGLRHLGVAPERVGSGDRTHLRWHLGPGPGPDYLDETKGHEWAHQTGWTMAANLVAAARADGRMQSAAMDVKDTQGRRTNLSRWNHPGDDAYDAL